MSHVCDIILVTAVSEGDDREIEPLQKYLRDKHHGCQLELVDDHAGGNKAVQADVWMAAINYLDLEEFLTVFRGMTWQSPECVQLFLKDEDDDRFHVHTV